MSADVDDLLKAIENGIVDDHLMDVARACRTRHLKMMTEVGARNKALLAVGDTVRLQNITPKYLAGLEAIVDRITDEGFYWVKLTKPFAYGRFANGRVICYPYQLEKIP